ncbi:SCL-interrupting locus protein homolog isoform X1 [Pungitius pungitius]|uniref:SCL-interrupting locus protein homolog isoform X1 n=1 Tax=Pungitius pungitius TaxID=134920 RepID=UPI002E1160E1
MSCPVNLQALPSGVFEAVFTPENLKGRTSMNSLTTLSFPKSRSALWDGSPAGEELRLGLCARRRPRLVLLEKALRLAQRHARHSNKPRLLCFLLGSVCIDADGEGVTVTLDRFDPGRQQAGSVSRVPSALLPGDVLVPCCVSTQAETPSDAAIQSEADLHDCFKALQQSVSGRQTLDLSQLMKVRGHVVCSQQSDAAALALSWSAVCPSVTVQVQPVRAVPVIPTALLRSLTGIDRPAPPPHAASRHRGFLTMDQTRKLLLLLESDPKASNLPLVGLWLSGVTHVSNPQVWAWCVRFLYSSALQDRVLSESRCFLLVLFASTHRAPQFFQCRGPGPGPGPGPAPQLDYQLLTAGQCVTLYQQVASVEGRTLQCELRSEDHSRQAEVFREARTSFSRTAPPAAGLSVSDQDSGVEDEDLSPRPSPSPHAPAQQARRVQPSVPELSLLMDSSFTSNQNARQSPGSAHRDPPPPPAAVGRKSAPPTINTTASSAPRPAAAPPHHHSTPNSNLQEPCSCCTTYNCTTIFSSPRLHPAPLPPSSKCHTPPPFSQPPSSLPLSSHHNTPPPPCSHHPASLPPSSHHHTPPPSFSQNLAPLPPSPHHNTPPPCGHHPASTPPSSHHPTTLSSSVLANSLSSLHYTPPPFSTHSPHSTSSPPPAPPPPCHCGHSPPTQWCGDSSSPRPSRPAEADSASPTRLFRPACVSQCCDQLGGVVPPDTYQLLLHQDRQLRLLQAQVQMLLQAQGRPQPSVGPVEAPAPRSTVSIAVGTGASLFWGEPVQSPLPPQEVPAPPSSYSSHGDLSVIGSAGRAEDREAACPPSGQNSVSGLQSPVLGESVSMYGEQQSFYHNLMTQVTSRLQESDSKQEVEEESRRRSLPESSQSRRRQSGGGDPVLAATVRQLQQLGVAVDRDDLTEPKRRVHETVESSSTLASINPAAVLSRLSVSEPAASALFSEGSVDLSLEANAIALRYLSDSQLSRLSVGGHAPRPGPASNHSLMSVSNMSLATRKYMRRYGLIEEEEEEDDDDEEEEEEEDKKQEADVLNSKLLPQGQLIRGPRPKTQPLVNAADKENRSGKRPSLLRASARRTDGSMGNILDLSRLRQLPKLF